ncbi:MAG: TldD/PmbA family protein [Candidatus Helarchaeota archaeon]
MLDLLETLIDQFLQKGAEFIDIRFQDNNFNNITIIDGKSRNIFSAKDRGIGIRIFINGGWGFACTDKVDKDSIIQSMTAAYKIAKVTGERAKVKFKLIDLPAQRKKIAYPHRKNLLDISIEEKLNLAIQLEKQAKAFDVRIVNSNVSYLDFIGDQILLNSFGTLLEMRVNFIRIVSLNYAMENGVRQRGFESIGATGGFEVAETEKAQNLGIHASEKAIRLLEAAPAKAGKFKVVLDPGLTGVFVHEAFGHACEADAILSGESILVNKIGSKVGQEDITIIDDPTLKGNFGYYPFDSEGIPSQKKNLVENGILKNYLHSLETASRLGGEPTGNARSQNYRTVPLVRMSNTYFKPSSWTVEELIEEVRNGLFLEGWSYGYTDPAKGSFTFKCKQAYTIENGEKRELLRDAAISGLTLETLNHVIGVGKTLEFSDGYCGKGGQNVPVSDGGPYIALRDCVVGGLQ